MKSALAKDVDRLFATQPAAWPLLARGIDGLKEAHTRRVDVAGRELLIRHIPHRFASTSAAVDPDSILRRRCFLCAANLPADEVGIPFDSSFIVYCNPFPILDRHLTIVHTEHRPQRIAGHFGAMLQLAAALPDSFILYNGPECGASAPDHLHFQSCSRAVFPIERDSRDLDGLFVPDYARKVIVFRDSDAAKLVDRLEKLIDILKDVTRRDGDSEPMINIAAYWERDGWTVLVFPRSKHRPRVFDTGVLTVSPATIDLCGVFVVPLPDDFARIHGPDIENIFGEVTLQEKAFEEVLARLGRK